MHWRRIFDYRTSELLTSLSEIAESRTLVGPTGPLQSVGENEDPVHPNMAEQLNDEGGTVENPCGNDQNMEKFPVRSFTPSVANGSEPALRMATKQYIFEIEPIGPIMSDGRSMLGAPLLPLSARADLSQFAAASMGRISIATASGALSPGPWISPAYLPIKSQHALLAHLQQVLEVSCYEFGRRVMPDVLRRRGWDCAESVELNRWTDEFQRGEQSFLTAAYTKKPLRLLLRSIANIRHCAVHRRKVPAKNIKQFLLDAEALVLLLGDVECSERIITIRQGIQMAIEELNRHRVTYHSKPGRGTRWKKYKPFRRHNAERNNFAMMERKEESWRNIERAVEEAIAASVARFSTKADMIDLPSKVICTDYR